MKCPECGDTHSGNEISPGSMSMICQRCHKDRNLMFQRANVKDPRKKNPATHSRATPPVRKPPAKPPQGSKTGKKH